MKKQAKYFISMLLIFVFTLFVLPTALASNWESHWSADYIRTALEHKWLQADENNEIHAGEAISRADFSVILWRALGSPQASIEAPFTDISSETKDAVNFLYEKGAITDSGDTKFSPDSTLSRQEAITMIAQILLLETSDYSFASSFSDWASVADWAKPGIAGMVAAQYVQGTGDNALSPGSDITLGETCALAVSIYGEGNRDHMWTTEAFGNFNSESIGDINAVMDDGNLIGVTVELTDALNGAKSTLFVNADDLVTICYDTDNKDIRYPTTDTYFPLRALYITEEGGTLHYYLQLVSINTDNDSYTDIIAATPYSDGEPVIPIEEDKSLENLGQIRDGHLYFEYPGADTVEALLSASTVSEHKAYYVVNETTYEKGNVLYFAEVNTAIEVSGRHSITMSKGNYSDVMGVEIAGGESNLTAFNSMESWNGYYLVQDTYTLCGTNINDTIQDKDIIENLKNVGILSWDVTYINRDGTVSRRSEDAMNNWYWHLDESTGEIRGAVGLRCACGVGVSDQWTNENLGTGCTIHNGVIEDNIYTGENDGTYGYFAQEATLTTYYIPATADLDAITYATFAQYSDEAALHENGGWIIWVGICTPEDVAANYGDIQCYHSGMYYTQNNNKSNGRECEDDSDYYWMHICGVQVYSDAEGASVFGK